MNKYKVLVLLFPFSFLLSSCSKKDSVVLSTREIKHLTIETIYDTISDNYLKYSTLSAKFDLSSSLLSMDAGGTIRIKKDSVIWISVVPMLGIEAARFQFTQDSIKFINRLKKEYFYGDYEYLKSLIGFKLDFNAIQALILNEIMLIDTARHPNEFTLDKTRKDNNFALIGFLDREVNKRKGIPTSLNHIFTINKSNLRPSRIEIFDYPNDREISIQYSDYMLIDSAYFPKIISIEANQKEKIVSLKLTFSKVKINISQDYIFSLPDNYKSLK